MPAARQLPKLPLSSRRLGHIGGISSRNREVGARLRDSFALFPVCSQLGHEPFSPLLCMKEGSSFPPAGGRLPIQGNG